MTEYEQMYLYFLSQDLQFRREQEVAMQKRHVEVQAYGARVLAQAEAHHERTIAATMSSTVAQNARAQAEDSNAKAGMAIAAANVATANAMLGDTWQLLAAVIARIDDRTSPEGKVDPVKAVAEVLAAAAALKAALSK